MNRERKFILIVGAVLLLLGSIYRFMPDMHISLPNADQIRIKEKQLAKYHERVQEKEELQQRLMAVNQEIVRSEAALLTADTTALAAVEIQNILNDIAGRSQIEINTMRVLAAQDAEEKAFLSIPVQVTFNCTTRQLKEILYGIEAFPKLLTISEFRTRLANVNDFENVQTTLTVKGFMKKEPI